MLKYFKNRKEKKLKQEALNNKYPVNDKYYQNGVIARPKYVELSNKVSKTYYLNKYGQNISYDEITKAFDLNLTGAGSKKFDYTIKYSIRDSQDLGIKRKINSVKRAIADQATTPILGLSTIEAGQRIKELEKAEAKMGEGDKMLNLVIVITIFADSLEELNLIDRSFQTQMEHKDWDFFAPFDGQKNAFGNSLPLPTIGGHSVKILASDLSRLLLPTSTRMSGIIPLGYDMIKKNIYFHDSFEGNRLHPATLTGSNGSGKSALGKATYEMNSLFGACGVYIDPEGECLPLAKELNCPFIELLKGGLNIAYYNDKITQFLDSEDYSLYNPVTEHVNWLINVLLRFSVWNEDIRKDKSDLNYILKCFYDDKNYGGKIENRNMRMLCEYVEKYDTTKEKMIWKGLKNFSVKEGGLYSNYFSTEEEFDFDKDFLIFSLQKIEDEELRKTYGYILLYKTFQSMIKKTKYRYVFIDELHLFLQYEGFKDLLIQYLKRCRKYNGCYYLITQELDDFRKYNALSILKEVSYNFIFNQIGIHPETYKLDQKVLDEIANLKVGQCIINKKGDSSYQKIKVYLKPYQLEYCKKEDAGTIKIDLSRRFIN